MSAALLIGRSFSAGSYTYLIITEQGVLAQVLHHNIADSDFGVVSCDQQVPLL